MKTMYIRMKVPLPMRYRTDNKTVTLTIKDNVNWHDGKPVTGADLEYAYLVMGSKDVQRCPL